MKLSLEDVVDGILVTNLLQFSDFFNLDYLGLFGGGPKHRNSSLGWELHMQMDILANKVQVGKNITKLLFSFKVGR